ncbi:DUF2500 domain-containing protein [Vibrio sp. NTOU-M3]|uniref:DUF2500 domain-containing protein n=1 Tax=Vibrio sp. NTOU-M3 TaxID=3234954 RepID=UPI00349F8232
MPISLFAAVVLLAVLAGWVFVGFYRRHIQGKDAPEQTAEVTILDKQAIEVDDVQPGQDDQEYWIYVQKGKIGPKREFQVGIHYYHALNPGDKGMLTYQGDKFLHFALRR